MRARKATLLCHEWLSFHSWVVGLSKKGGDADKFNSRTRQKLLTWQERVDILKKTWFDSQRYWQSQIQSELQSQIQSEPRPCMQIREHMTTSSEWPKFWHCLPTTKTRRPRLDVEGTAKKHTPLFCQRHNMLQMRKKKQTNENNNNCTRWAMYWLTGSKVLTTVFTFKLFFVFFSGEINIEI